MLGVLHHHMHLEALIFNLQSQRVVIQEANCGIQDWGSIASNRSIIGGKVLFQEHKSVSGIVSQTK